MKKFLPLLNRPACNGPFLPKFWTALATVIVGIFFRKKIWWGLRPISVAYQKEFWISWKKQRFQIFQKPSSPGFQSFLVKHSKLYIQFIYEADLSKFSSISVLSQAELGMQIKTQLNWDQNCIFTEWNELDVRSAMFGMAEFWVSDFESICVFWTFLGFLISLTNKTDANKIWDQVK